LNHIHILKLNEDEGKNKRLLNEEEDEIKKLMDSM
jgi:hypothetical protein